MANSTTLAKPAKPSPDFPLFAHASGRWAKKIRGNLCYFGYWRDDPEGKAALKRYKEQAADLHAGRTPGRVARDGVTIKHLADAFLTAKEQERDAGDIRPQTFADYFATCKMVAKAFGKTRLVDDIDIADFNALRAKLADRYGPHSLCREVTQTRMLFRFGYENGLLEKPVRFGTTFKRPDKKKMRAHRQQSVLKNGKRMFEAAQVRKLIDVAKQPLKAMILLGINCGFGNEDCARLPKSAVDLDAGWVNFPRPKTAVERRCPLWPETIAAIRDAIDQRPRVKDRNHDDLIFVTKYGLPWWKNTTANPVSQEFRKLLNAIDSRAARAAKKLKLQPPAKVYRPGVGFYALRHTFETIGGDSRDQVAVDFLMGHSDESMAAVYREGIGDDRLQDVVNHVYAWLYPRPTVG